MSFVNMWGNIWSKLKWRLIDRSSGLLRFNVGKWRGVSDTARVVKSPHGIIDLTQVYWSLSERLILSHTNGTAESYVLCDHASLNIRLLWTPQFIHLYNKTIDLWWVLWSKKSVLLPRDWSLQSQLLVKKHKRWFTGTVIN